jgi:sensor histidine kinase YesM
MHKYRRTNTNYHNNKTRIHDNNNTVILKKKVNDYKLTFAVFIGSLFFVLILVVIALQGIQQLVVNFAFPVVLLSSWFLVLIFVVMIKNIGNINKGSIDIFLFESRFVEKKTVKLVTIKLYTTK